MFKQEFYPRRSFAPVRTAWRLLRANKTRNAATALVLLLSTAFFGWHLNRVHPVQDWLFLSYLRLWGLVSLFGGSSFAIGWRALDKLVAAPPRLLERSALAMALGVLIFYLATYVGGVLGLYQRTFFYALPVLLLALAAPKCLGDLLRLRRRLGGQWSRLYAPRGTVELVVMGFLFIAVTAIYVPIVVPNNISYDAQWYHLVIAEDYVAAGGIHPFREGWFLGAYPHLSSILYAWALCGPGVLYERVLLCAHLEFVLFLGTLIGVSALASRLAGRRSPYAAAALFLFPGIFVYDSCLSSGADHILAFWTPVVALSLLRLARRRTLREAVLSGALTAAAACTKYQAIYIVVPAALFALSMVLRRRNWAVVLAWFSAAGVVTATHWLKNLVYYRDPLYPMLCRWFPCRPFNSEGADWVTNYFWTATARPAGTGWDKYLNAALASLNFSLSPDGSFAWDSKGLPLAGSAFTLLIPALLLMRRTGRLWWQVGAIQLGLVIWYLTTHQERFLQTLTPWMAAVTAAIVIRLWHEGRLKRIGVVPLVGLQMVWGADLFALPRHAMNGHAPLHLAIEHFASSYDKNKTARFGMPSTLEHLRSRMAGGSRVLLHVWRLHLGLGVEVVTDETGWQGAINYLDHERPLDTIRLFRKMGITKLMWQPNRSMDNPGELAREVVFLRAVHQVAMPESLARDWFIEDVRKVEASPELAVEATRFLWLGCGLGRARDYYSPRGWERGEREQGVTAPLPTAPPGEVLAPANAVAVERRCAGFPEVLASLDKEFVRAGAIVGVEIWVRRVPGTE